MDSEHLGLAELCNKSLRITRQPCVSLLRGDVALCCVVLLTHLSVMFPALGAARTDTHLTQSAASFEHFLLPTR